jgi:hypothetical protein
MDRQEREGIAGIQRSRTERHRQQHRRILILSLGLAGLLHLAVFALNPGWMLERISFFDPRSPEDREGPPEVGLVDVSFGPPQIFLADGRLRPEPADRLLDAKGVDMRGIRWAGGCAWVRTGGFGMVEGEVTLKVGPEGFVQEARISQSSGDACLDQMLVAISGTLWYRWLPNETYPAPVTLLQPMTVDAVS